MSANPPLMWAQDTTRVFITIKLQDVQNEEIIFRPGEFVFKGQVRNPDASYNHTFELFEEVIPDDPETKYNKFGRYLQLNLTKKDSSIWWPRLAKTANKLHHVRIDWEKWVDDDEVVTKKYDKPKKSGRKNLDNAPAISEST
jgi:prostaglandin-E synthase